MTVYQCFWAFALALKVVPFLQWEQQIWEQLAYALQYGNNLSYERNKCKEMGTSAKIPKGDRHQLAAPLAAQPTAAASALLFVALLNNAIENATNKSLGTLPLCLRLASRTLPSLTH